MTGLHDILEELDLNDSLSPWKDSLKTGWLKRSWHYLVESFNAEYQESLCESLSVFCTLMAIYVSFTRIAWDSIDTLYLDDLANSIDVNHAKFGLLASKYAPDDLESLLSVDDDLVLKYCLETIVEALRPGVVSVLKKSYGGEAHFYLSLPGIQVDETFEDIDPEYEEDGISNWESFSKHVCSDGYDFETYMEHNLGLPENIIARWVIESCPILWDQLSY